jgi:hypothetical protein
MRQPKRVTFDSQSDEIILSCNECSKECLGSRWYSAEELARCKDDARQIVNLVRFFGDNLDAIDHSKVCVVGLEKYQNAYEKVMHQKLLIRSVLIRQQLNRSLGITSDANGLCEISEVISNPFKQCAQRYAAMHEVHAHGSLAPDNVDTDQATRALAAKRRRLISGYCN